MCTAAGTLSFKFLFVVDTVGYLRLTRHISSFVVLRSGGGIGSGDIRKMAYFESSIDPSITREEVCD